MALASISISQFTPQNIESLNSFFKAIVESGLDTWFHPHPFDMKQASLICNYKGENWSAGAFVKEPGGSEKIVGYVILRGWEEGYNIPSFGVCVLPQWQNRQIGRDLTLTAIDIAKHHNSPSIRLKVYPDNHKAISLYQNLGFIFDNSTEEGQKVGRLYLTNEQQTNHPGTKFFSIT